MTATAPDVLVVDDDAAVRDVVARRLARAGFRVQRAATAEEAWHAVADGAPGVLVTDVEMPGHDGVWLAQQIRARHPETALVVISADPSAGRALTHARLGVFDYLSKPFSFDDLVETVERATRWHAERVRTPACAPPPPQAWAAGGEWVPSADALSRLLSDVLSDQ